jgi:kinetochore protein Mis13/DSN1
MREDPDVDEDVRMMENEAEGLRRLSIARGGGVLAGEGMDPAFRFPVPGSGAPAINGVLGKKKKIKKGKEREKETDSYDTIEELSQGDTPQMARNKLMRAAHSQSDTEGPSTENANSTKASKTKGQNTTNRKSSASTRGKRVSNLFEGGIICKSPFPPCFLH